MNVIKAAQLKRDDVLRDIETGGEFSVVRRNRRGRTMLIHLQPGGSQERHLERFDVQDLVEVERRSQRWLSSGSS